MTVGSMQKPDQCQEYHQRQKRLPHGHEAELQHLASK